MHYGTEKSSRQSIHSFKTNVRFWQLFIVWALLKTTISPFWTEIQNNRLAEMSNNGRQGAWGATADSVLLLNLPEIYLWHQLWGDPPPWSTQRLRDACVTHASFKTSAWERWVTTKLFFWHLRKAIESSYPLWYNLWWYKNGWQFMIFDHPEVIIFI